LSGKEYREWQCEAFLFPGLAQISSGNGVRPRVENPHLSFFRSISGINGSNVPIRSLAQIERSDESRDTEDECWEECSDDEDCFLECLAGEPGQVTSHGHGGELAQISSNRGRKDKGKGLAQIGQQSDSSDSGFEELSSEESSFLSLAQIGQDSSSSGNENSEDAPFYYQGGSDAEDGGRLAQVGRLNLLNWHSAELPSRGRRSVGCVGQSCLAQIATNSGDRDC